MFRLSPIPHNWEEKMVLNSKLRQSGFTLLELMVTVAIVGILLSLAVPSFRILIQNNRQVARTNDFVTTMHLARSEAVKHGVSAWVTARAPIVGDEWGAGWMMWVDVNGNAAMDPVEVLRDVDLTGMAGNITIGSAGGNAAYEYDPDGTLNIGGADTVSVCDSSRAGEAMRQITTAATGRVSLNTINACP